MDAEASRSDIDGVIRMVACCRECESTQVHVKIDARQYWNTATQDWEMRTNDGDMPTDWCDNCNSQTTFVMLRADEYGEEDDLEDEVIDEDPDSYWSEKEESGVR